MIAGRFAARQLRSELSERAHLVLGANPRHRSVVVERTPSVLGRTFSLREFARLAAAVDPRALPAEPVARAHALVDQALLQRGLVPQGPDGDAIPDPMGRPPSAHHEAAMLIAESVDALVGVIAPTG